MQVEDVKTIAEREPFRPFSVRLSNGQLYSFNKPRDLGAPTDYRTLFYFGNGGTWVLIDSENIVEIIQNTEPRS